MYNIQNLMAGLYVRMAPMVFRLSLLSFGALRNYPYLYHSRLAHPDATHHVNNHCRISDTCLVNVPAVLMLCMPTLISC